MTPGEEASLTPVIGTQDAVILGRRSYTEWAGFWPGSEIEPFAIAPRIAGHGRRLLDGVPSTRLEPIRSEISATGYLLVDYRVIR